MIRIDSILIVDDDPTNIFLHQSIIEQLNIVREIFTSSNGKDAYDLIEKRYHNNQSLPSLILLDINMPGLSGFELIAQLKDCDLLSVKKIPVTLLTSSNSQHDIDKARELGIKNYVTKPLSEEKLIKIFNSIQSRGDAYLID